MQRSEQEVHEGRIPKDHAKIYANFQRNCIININFNSIVLSSLTNRILACNNRSVQFIFNCYSYLFFVLKQKKRILKNAGLVPGLAPQNISTFWTFCSSSWPARLYSSTYIFLWNARFLFPQFLIWIGNMGTNFSWVVHVGSSCTFYWRRWYMGGLA